MKLHIFFFAILASVQIIYGGYGDSPAEPEPSCEITKEALAELAELREIVAQLTVLVGTLTGEPPQVRRPVCPWCSDQYEPVCGSDRKTYRNSCGLETAICEGVEVELAYTGPCSTEEDALINPTLSVKWNSATVTWVAPVDEVFGYVAKVNSSESDEVTVRLPSGETSFSYSVSVNTNYTIEIVPIMGDGPGTAYESGVFMPTCPQACTYQYDPVCGTDRKTYGNPCTLDVAMCNDGAGTLALAYSGPCTTEEDELVEPSLEYTWKEATVSWSAPVDEVLGYTVKVISEEGEVSTRLSAFDVSFETSVSPKQNYTIEITPIMGDGPGTTYSTGIFIPVCPLICTLEYAPLCATDGTTYSNDCALEVAQCESGDATLEIDHPGTCDPCVDILCDVPLCEEGFVVAPEPSPGECCPGCVDECELIACDVVICAPGYTVETVEGECCPGCVLQDPCALVLCDPPSCEEGFVVAPVPSPGECCPGCVDECSLIACDPPQCEPGYNVGTNEGDCCPGCLRQVFEDCRSAQDAGMTINGAYLIQPVGLNDPVEVYCDFQNDGGGWTVILRRVPSEVDFLRSYDEYVAGFGDANEAHWIGLETLYRLNKQGNTKMYISGTDHEGNSAAGQYNIFRVGPSEDNYALETIVGFRGKSSGNIGNGLAYNKGAAFSAPDRDNDGGDRDCAAELNGGWWYKGTICSRANPLGEFLTPDEFSLERGIFWAPFKGKGKSLQFLELKIRPA